MQNIDSKFCEDFKKAESCIERLVELFKNHDLPDDLNDPQKDADSSNVTWFANKVYGLGCDLAELGENMMVGAKVDENWNDKDENTMTYAQKLADVGHSEGDF